MVISTRLMLQFRHWSIELDDSTDNVGTISQSIECISPSSEIVNPIGAVGAFHTSYLLHRAKLWSAFSLILREALGDPWINKYKSFESERRWLLSSEIASPTTTVNRLAWLGLSFLSTTQWEAVTTCRSPTKEPPQMWYNLPLYVIRRDTCQGQECLGAFSPPTTRLVKWRLPQPEIK